MIKYEKLSRTRQRPLTLAAFLPWGDWVTCRHVRALTTLAQQLTPENLGGHGLEKNHLPLGTHLDETRPIRVALQE